MYVCFSDTMGNRGAFITLNGKDMKPYFTSYEAMVRILYSHYYTYIYILYCSYIKKIV